MNRRAGIELFALSFAALFLELMVIRWAPSVVRLVAYYGNLMLISSFLGLGVGAMLAGTRRRLLGWFGLLLAAEVALLLLCQHELLPTHRSEARFYGIPSQRVWNYLMLVGLFVFNAGMFVPLGQRIGQLFQALPPLRAYAWDLGGSLAGTLCFGAFSFTRFSPIIGFVVVMVVVGALLKGRARWINLPLFVLIGVAVWRSNDPHAIWSPYYYIGIRLAEGAKILDEQSASVSQPPADLRVMKDPPAYAVHVNHDYYQLNADLNDARYTAGSTQQHSAQTARSQYELPYRLAKRPEQVLVIGAGGGADTQVALLSGARHVDAVEIDPGLVRLSRRFNASGVFDDPRVTVHVNDARAFIRQTRSRYDLVVFGFLDSQTLFSYMSNLRLDGYIYTVQSIRSAYGLLRDDGMLTLSFAAQQPWLALKLVRMVAEGTGTTPIVYMLRGKIIICAPHGARPDAPGRIGDYERVSLESIEQLDKIKVPTDDWPYLYLSEMTIPLDYRVVILTLLGISLASVLAIRGRGLHATDGHFFLLGLAFLLLETKSITDCSLYFGTTWLVTTVVVAGVLIMVLAANLLAMRMRRSSLWLYLPLMLALAALYAVPRDWVLNWSSLARVAWTLLVVPLPIFFAGLIFSTSYRNAAGAAQLLGANLIGAMVGGFCEYLGMAIGNDRLLLLVMVAYVGSLLLRTLGAKHPGMATPEYVSLS